MVYLSGNDSCLLRDLAEAIRQGKARRFHMLLKLTSKCHSVLFISLTTMAIIFQRKLLNMNLNLQRPL